MTHRAWIAVILTAVVLLVGGLRGAAPDEASSEPKTVTVEGKLVAVADVLNDRHGVRLDEDAAKILMAVERPDGSLVPLLKNIGSQMMIAEHRLRGRTVRVRGRMYPGLSMLDVIGYHIVEDGKLFEAYYWCDTCVIKVHRSGVCPCCPDQVVYKEAPIKP